MTDDEISKMNNLFKQIDDLTSENEWLKANTHDHSDLTTKLESIEAKLDKLLDKGKTK